MATATAPNTLASNLDVAGQWQRRAARLSENVRSMYLRYSAEGNIGTADNMPFGLLSALKMEAESAAYAYGMARKFLGCDDTRYVYRVNTLLGFVLILAHGAASAEIKAEEHAREQGFTIDGRASLATDDDLAWAKEHDVEVLS